MSPLSERRACLREVQAYRREDCKKKAEKRKWRMENGEQRTEISVKECKSKNCEEQIYKTQERKENLKKITQENESSF